MVRVAREVGKPVVVVTVVSLLFGSRFLAVGC